MEETSKFTLRQLELFRAAADHGSFAAAAATLYLTPNAVSLAVRDLERVLGTHLCVRQRARGLTLTPAGMQLLERARTLLRDADDLYWSVSDAGPQLRGPVTVGCYSTLAPTVVPPLLQTFNEAHPDVELRIVDGPLDALLAPLEAGEIDLMISYRFGLPRELEQVVLSETTAHVLLPEDHRLAQADSVALDDLASDPLILLDLPPSGDHTLDMLARAGAHPEVAHRTSNFELVRSLVGRGFGYSLLIQRPRIDVNYEGTTVVTKTISPTLSVEHVVISWPQRMRLTERARALVEHARAAVVSQHWHHGDIQST